jgi:outer membrane protein assembly factor BamB
VPFTAGSFGTVTEATSFTVPVFNNISIAGNLFFGDRNAKGKYYAYDTSLAAIGGWPTAQMGDVLTSSPAVSTSYVYGTAGSGDGVLRAFNKSDGSAAWTFTTGTGPSAMGALSSVALGVDNTVYFTEDNFLSFYAIAPPATGTSGNFAAGWSVAYKGSNGTTPDTTIDSVSTEPSLDNTGVAYFGTNAGKVFAIITDSNGSLPSSPGTTWPRVGYDNCNSSNTAFSCQ